MPKLFLSYRRDDSAVVAGRIFDRLQAHFGRSAVYMDVDSIPLGTDFRKHLTDAVGSCDVLLAVIGPDWLKVQENGRRRLDDANDFVRIEVKAALDRNIPVVPILLGHTLMPLEEHLPDDLKDLAYRQAAQVDPGKDFHLYMDRIVKKLDALLSQPRPAPVPAVAVATAAPAPAPTSGHAPVPAVNPDLDALVRSVQVVMAWNSTDNRGQVFGRLKIVLGNVDAVFAYLEGLLDRVDEDLVEKATAVLLKHAPHPSERAVRQGTAVVQTATNGGVRRALVAELGALLKANRSAWDPGLQRETLEALKFVAGYDANHLIRLAAIEAVGSLQCADGTDFLVSLIRAKKGAGETTPDWSHAVSTLAKCGGADGGRALARLCSELQHDPEVLQSIVYWVKCNIHRFEQSPNDVKNGLWEGAKAVLDGFETLTHPPFAEAAFTVWMCFAPDDAVTTLAAHIDPACPGRRRNLARSLASVEAHEQKKRFLRRLKQRPGAAQAVAEALRQVAADPESDEYAKKAATKALELLQTA